MDDALEALNAELKQVEEQLERVNKLHARRHELRGQIREIENMAKLAEYGLAVGDNVLSTAEFAGLHSSTQGSEGQVLELLGVGLNQVVVRNSRGITYGVSFEMAQCMKKAAN